MPNLRFFFFCFGCDAHGRASWNRSLRFAKDSLPEDPYSLRERFPHFTDRLCQAILKIKILGVRSMEPL